MTAIIRSPDDWASVVSDGNVWVVVAVPWPDVRRRLAAAVGIVGKAT
jgi:hypothetical protein